MNREQRRLAHRTVDLHDKASMVKYLKSLVFKQADGRTGHATFVTLESGIEIPIENASEAQLREFVRKIIQNRLGAPATAGSIKDIH